MCVFHRRGNLRMTHELLDGDEIDAEANKASGERMAKIVKTAACDKRSTPDFSVIVSFFRNARSLSVPKGRLRALPASAPSQRCATQ